ncbi:MAG: hypothetical protein PHR42_01280, partial [Caldisericia bacterium]|nr:hypothetical protein [Caldisericia bacterium]
MQKEKSEKIKIEFNEHYLEHSAFAENYFRKRMSGKNDAEELSSDAMLHLYKAMQRKMVPLEERKKILSKICRDLYASYCRKKKDREAVSLENAKGCLADKDENIEKLPLDLLWQTRAVLLCPHRSLQEVTILSQAPSCPKLVRKIKQKFPLTTERYVKYGPYIEFIRKEEKTTKGKKSSHEKEMPSFIEIIFDAAKFFKVNDDIGISALKILFLAENPWKDWYFLSQSGKFNDYLCFNDKGRLIRKKRIKGPLSSLFRD